MRLKTALAFIVAFVTAANGSLHGATSYRYAAVCNYDLCLIAENGRNRIVLSKSGRSTSWIGPAVSPKNGLIIAALCDDKKPQATRLYEIDPMSGKQHLIAGGNGYRVVVPQVWLSPETLLVERSDKDGFDGGIFSLNIRTGVSKQVVPPRHEELPYDQLILSPSGQLLATSMGETGGSWVSVNEVASGKRCWQTNPNNGMSGFTGLAWSTDSRTLFMSFYLHNDDFADGPGGLWKFDARTGAKRLWKYAKQDVDGVWSVPSEKVLLVEQGDWIDFLRMSDGNRLTRIPVSRLGGLLWLFSPTRGRLILCGTDQVIETDLSGRSIWTHPASRLASYTVRFSPTRGAAMYGGVSESGIHDDVAGVLDLKTGQVTKFAANDWYVEWLLRDITR